MGVAPGCARLFTRGGRPHRSAPLVRCQAMAFVESVRRRWRVSIDFDLDLDPVRAAELGLPVDRGQDGPELFTRTWSHVTRAAGELEAEVAAERTLRQLCRSRNWPPPQIRRVLVFEAGWFGRLPRQAPRRMPPAGDHPAPVSASPEDQARRPHRPQPRLPTDSQRPPHSRRTEVPFGSDLRDRRGLRHYFRGRSVSARPC